MSSAVQRIGLGGIDAELLHGFDQHFAVDRPFIRQWIPGRYVALGTDGFGRSDGRAALRHHFEVDRRYVVLAALKALADEGSIDRNVLVEAVKKLGVDPDKANPLNS